MFQTFCALWPSNGIPFKVGPPHRSAVNELADLVRVARHKFHDLATNDDQECATAMVGTLPTLSETSDPITVVRITINVNQLIPTLRFREVHWGNNNSINFMEKIYIITPYTCHVWLARATKYAIVLKKSSKIATSFIE